jgi:hypothetical protein
MQDELHRGPPPRGASTADGEGFSGFSAISGFSAVSGWSGFSG